jgi:hypothetical protein
LLCSCGAGKEQQDEQAEEEEEEEKTRGCSLFGSALAGRRGGPSDSEGYCGRDGTSSAGNSAAWDITKSFLNGIA